MAYTVIANPGIDPRPELATWDMNVPGLYTTSRRGAPCQESVVLLDTGEKIAVSVEEEFNGDTLDTGLFGWARVINDDGSSKTSPDGVPLEAVLSVGASRADVEQFGLDTFRKEVLLTVLGEPGQATRPIANGAPVTQAFVDQAAQLLTAGGASPDASVAFDPTATSAPLLMIPDSQRQTCNIRAVLATMAHVTAAPDPATLLG